MNTRIFASSLFLLPLWACTDGSRLEEPVTLTPQEAGNAPAPRNAAEPQWVENLDQRFPRASLGAPATIRRTSGELVSHVEDYRRRPALGVVLPDDATEPVQLRARGGELSIRFRLLGARAARGEVLRDKVVYESAGPARADLALRVGPRGVEDFLYFSEPTKNDSVSYEVRLDGVAGVRLVSNTVEYIDAAGVPRLRTTRPVVRDARGRKLFGTTRLSGCAYDTDVRVPWGRPVVDPESDTCEVTISWNADGLEHPLTLDPGWVATDDLADARSFHTATLLEDGTVLVAGGQQDGTPLASSEIYEPSADAWAMGDDLADARYLHTATTLQDGTVLVVGGYGEDETKLATTERYSDGWITVTRMPEGRAEHTATRLPNDNVVVIGGGGLAALTFDPEAAEWTSAGTASTDRYGHAALYVDGVVLAIGGASTPLPAEEALNSVESFDPPNGPFTTLPPMRFGRHGHTATLLANERVLVVGKAREAEIYDALDEVWEVTASPPTAGRWYHAAVELESQELGDQVLFVGGLFGNTTYDSSEFFVPDGEGWTRLDLRMNAKRFAHRATALNPGAVLLSGGQEGFGEPLAVTEKVVFIEPGEPCETSGECFTGYCVDGVCCESECDGECQACSEERGSSADGVCDVLDEGISCTAGVGECSLGSYCDGESPDCEVSEFTNNGDGCNDDLDETENDRCQQGICRGDPIQNPPPGGAPGTGGEPGSGGGGGSGAVGGSGGSGGSGGEAGKAPEQEPEAEPLPTPLSCSLDPASPLRAPGEISAWWVLLALMVGRRKAGERAR